jgi:sensor histidine kinase regulating citrate/malate metabolism
VVGYYVAQAEKEGAQVDVKLDIPEQTGQIAAVDICVIVGNLLENAIFALQRVTTGHKYIKARAKTTNDTMSIIVENNYDGKWEKNNDVFVSSKPAATKRDGVGLASVKAVAEKYDGLMRVEPQPKTWRVSILLNGAQS